MVVCGIKCVDLTTEVIKILGVIIFKTLALSKIVYLTLITSFSKELIEVLQKNTKSLHLEQLDSKIKHGTLENSFEKGHGLNDYMMTSFMNEN